MRHGTAGVYARKVPPNDNVVAAPCVCRSPGPAATGGG